MHCPSCNHDNRADCCFCTQCGATLSVACPSCGAPAEAGENFCGGCGAPLPTAALAPGAPTPAPEPKVAFAAGERRQLTVLFCDLVGSTPLSQQLDAEEWRDLIVQYQQAAAGAVARFGGHVAKNLGDGLLIYFGWPTAREDDPERAVRAGLAIVDAVASLNSTLDDATRLAVRIGLHTGPVVIADGGEVFGETANIAARVQGAGEPDTVMITAATQRLVSGIFVVEDRRPQRLKGVREPMTLYRVVQPSGVRSRLAVAAGHLTRFVGRDVELATLFDRWERARDGEGQNVVVLGEAGVGKSRLVYQLHERLKTVPHTWLECSATPYTEGTPFHPVIALVSQGLAFTSDDSAADKLAKLEVGLRALASRVAITRGGQFDTDGLGGRSNRPAAADPPDRGRAQAENVALIAEFLGLPSPTPLQFSPDLQRRKTIGLLAQWNLALSEVQPLILVVEDLHWCDVSTLEVLGHLIAQSPTARVLLIATGRPEFTPPWPSRSNLTTVQLGRLTKRQARDMIASLAGATLPATTLDALVTRADGVPLYVEELTKATSEPGAARGLEAIPASLADSLMARLDRLSAAKEVAQRAAVLGREFSYGLLAAMADMDEETLQQGLARLLDAELVFVRGAPPEATYIFKHALIQETAYESLLKRTRQQLHARVVDVLLACFPERVETEPEMIAHHAQKAGRNEAAVLYLQRAGERAQNRSAHGDAILQFREALRLLAQEPETTARNKREGQLQLALAPSLAAARGYAHAETETAYGRVLELTAVMNREEHLSALVGLGNVYLNSARFDAALELIDRALGMVEGTPSDWHAVAAYREKIMIACFQGRFRETLEYGKTLTTLYDPSRHHGRIVSLIGDDANVVARSFLAWTLWFLGYPEQANASASGAIEAGDTLEHPFSAALARYFAASLHWMSRNVAAQRRLAEELIQVSSTNGFPFWGGLATALRGHADRNPAEVAEGMAIVDATGNQAAAPLLLAVPAETYRACGLHTEGRAAVERGIRISAQTQQPFFDAELQRLRAEILLGVNAGAAEAEALFTESLQIARQQQAKSLELRAATSLARLWRDQGRRTQARDLLAPVYAWFTEGFDTADLQDAKTLLEELGG